jgi:hypothetical protein
MRYDKARTPSGNREIRCGFSGPAAGLLANGVRDREARHLRRLFPSGVRHFRCGLLLLLGMLAIFSATGCTAVRGLREYVAYNEQCEEAVLNWRDYCWSWQAWRFRRSLYRGQPQFFDFGEGFRAGYVNIASGGDGCPPALPPRRYWNYGFQTAEGQSKVAAWFAGFPEGVRAAKEDGVGLYRDIQVSGSVTAMGSPEYLNGQDPTCGEVYLGPVDQSLPGPAGALPAEPGYVPLPPQSPDMPSSAPQAAPAEDAAFVPPRAPVVATSATIHSPGTAGGGVERWPW